MSQLIKNIDNEDNDLKVIINDSMVVDGAFWFEAEIFEEGEKVFYTIRGELEAKAPYIDVPITSIGNKKYQISKVKVHKERYGSRDPYIVYAFTAESYTVFPEEEGEI